MRALRPIYLISILSLFIVAGFWVHSFIGIGHIGYSSFPPLSESVSSAARDPFDGSELAQEFEWVIAAEAGSITLVKIPHIRYLHLGFYFGFSGFGEGSVVGDGGGRLSRLTGHFRFHHCSEQDNFYGFPCLWIGSVPFWFPTMILGIVATFARRLYTQAKSEAQQVAP